MVVDIWIAEISGGVRKLSPDKVELRDSRGRSYDVLSVRVTDRGLRVIADEAPTWWGVKYFELTLPALDTSSGRSILLRKPFADIIRREVDELSR